MAMDFAILNVISRVTALKGTESVTEFIRSDAGMWHTHTK
jgi:hypothetical protein